MLRCMTIDRALKITCALKHHKDVCLDNRVWVAYYNLLEDALMQIKMDSSSTVGEHCVARFKKEVLEEMEAKK